MTFSASNSKTFAALLEAAPDAVVVVDPSGRVVLVNAQTERLFGHPRDSLVGQPVEVLVPGPLRAVHARHRDLYAAEPRVRRMGPGLDLLGQRADGTSFPVEISLSPVAIDGGMFTVATVRDIGERQEAERRLRASEQRFRALLESAPDAVVITDREGRIVLVNAQTERLFGYARQSLLGASVDVLVPEAHRDRHAGHRADYVAAPRPRAMGSGLELMGRREDGTVFPVEISLSPVTAGEETLIVADIRDVSERLEAERHLGELHERLRHDNAELAALNRELEAFSYSVSHDLRAPLRAIDGFSQALLEDCAGELGAEGQRYLNRVREAAQRMGHLIDDLLKLSRVTRSEVRPEPVDLAAIAREALRELQEAAPERQAEIRIEEPLQARGDARLLRIALENLLGNAWKFTAARPVAHIRVGRCRRDGDEAFFVADNGAGFDMAYADQLFRAFQRLHDARDFPGTGIGLATVQRILTKHGGRIWVEARPGEGATFYFTL